MRVGGEVCVCVREGGVLVWEGGVCVCRREVCVCGRGMRTVPLPQSKAWRCVDLHSNSNKPNSVWKVHFGNQL